MRKAESNSQEKNKTRKHQNSKDFFNANLIEHLIPINPTECQGKVALMEETLKLIINLLTQSINIIS